MKLFAPQDEARHHIGRRKMDPATLAATALAAALPYLVTLGKEAAKGAAGAAGKSVWGWITGKLTSEAGKEVVRDIESDPNDADSRKALEATLSKYLRSDTAAQHELRSLLTQAGAISVHGDINVTAMQGSVAAGGSIIGSTISTGTSKPRT
jgi:hypothetical protein